MRIIIIKSLSTTLSTRGTEVQGSSAGVAGAVSASDLDSYIGVGQIMGLGNTTLDLGCAVGEGEGE